MYNTSKSIGTKLKKKQEFSGWKYYVKIDSLF